MDENFTPNPYRLIFLLILSIGVSVYNGYLGITFAYFPAVAHKAGLGQSSVGIVLALMNITTVSFSFLTPVLMKRIRRKSLILFSLIVGSLSIYLFGSLSFVTHKKLFIMMSVTARLGMGLGMSVFQTCSYSYSALLYKDNTQKGMGMIQAFTGIGPLVCILLSTVIFGFFGYFVTFATLATIMFLVAILVIFFVPNLQDTDPESTPEPRNESFKSWYIFLDCRIIGCCLTTAFTMIMIDAPSPFLADRMDDFNIPEYLKALTFLIPMAVFTITALVIARVIKSKNVRRITLSTGWILMGIGFIFLGPSSTIHLPENLPLMFFGFSLIGVAYAFLIVTNIPLIEDYAKEYDTVGGEYGKVANYVAGAFSAFSGLGSFAGPLVSPPVKNRFGWKGFTDIFGLICIGALLIFGICHLVPRWGVLGRHKVKGDGKKELEEKLLLEEDFVERSQESTTKCDL